MSYSKIVKEKGFKIIDEFSINDIYFIPEEVDLYKIDTIDIIENISNKRAKLITFKVKNFDKFGNIIKSRSC